MKTSLAIATLFVISDMLILRTFSLYERNKAVLAYMIFVTLGKYAFALGILFARNDDRSVSARLAAFGCPIATTHSNLAVAWSILAVRLSARHSGQLLTILIRDGAQHCMRCRVDVLRATNYKHKQRVQYPYVHDRRDHDSTLPATEGQLVRPRLRDDSTISTQHSIALGVRQPIVNVTSNGSAKSLYQSVVHSDGTLSAAAGEMIVRPSKKCPPFSLIKPQPLIQGWPNFTWTVAGSASDNRRGSTSSATVTVTFLGVVHSMETLTSRVPDRYTRGLHHPAGTRLVNSLSVDYAKRRPDEPGWTVRHERGSPGVGSKAEASGQSIYDATTRLKTEVNVDGSRKLGLAVEDEPLPQHNPRRRGAPGAGVDVPDPSPEDVGVEGFEPPRTYGVDGYSTLPGVVSASMNIARLKRRSGFRAHMSTLMDMARLMKMMGRSHPGLRSYGVTGYSMPGAALASMTIA
ncbi:hypothetical protein GGX14DRAFT_393926 [Mycena pura]|uniref:Uncharacterized protein n=1 Tax=Mycena pura TaxID=153505 RepID=A0AAD6VGT1_9AGAR|nr:hypothetical protein GGX14DRAFT_393926 [Mycena pura]